MLGAGAGSIVGLADRRAGAELLLPSSECLWSAEAGGGAAAGGGCAFGRSGPARFSYRWTPRSSTLALRYDRTGGLSALVTLRARASALDLRLTLRNESAVTVERVHFPADLSSPVAAAEAGYGPHALPGVRLAPGFFRRVGGATFTYPSRWAFVDWLGLDSGGGHLALSSVNPPPAPLAPVDIGFVHGDVGRCSGPRFCAVHAFRTWIRPGESWTSPVVRLRVGDPIDAELVALRRESGIDAFPSLEQKLGPRLDALVRAPLLKADLWHGLHPFAEWGPDLRRLPSPALLHPVSFQPGGHDESFPDFLPPDRIWGTTAELRSALEEARGLGVLSMPYLNVSWWRADSPTLRSLPAGTSVGDLAGRGADGRPLLERYGDRVGYLVSPWAPLVRDRVQRLLEQWRSEVPVDCLFFDQLGARPWQRDLSPSAPGPLAYEDGWLSLLAPYADRCLMVEDGWDRLAASFSGFHGSLLLGERQEQLPDSYFGAGNWQPYPLAPPLLHDKVLLYQHDLYEGTMTADPEVLLWNMAFGNVLSYAWDGDARTLDGPWPGLVGDLQRTLGPLVAGKPFLGWQELGRDLTRSDFGTLAVVANWSQAAWAERDGYGLPPLGWLARSPDDAVVAGALAGRFAGAPLAPGRHYLVVERTGEAVAVRQPLGPETDIELAPPSASRPDAPLHAYVQRADGLLLQEVPLALRAGRVVLHLAEGPSAYRIVAS